MKKMFKLIRLERNLLGSRFENLWAYVLGICNKIYTHFVEEIPWRQILCSSEVLSGQKFLERFTFACLGWKLKWYSGGDKKVQS